MAETATQGVSNPVLVEAPAPPTLELVEDEGEDAIAPSADAEAGTGGGGEAKDAQDPDADAAGGEKPPPCNPNDVRALLRKYWVAGVCLLAITALYVLAGTLAEPFQVLPWQGWLSLAVVTLLVFLLTFNTLPTHVLFALALAVLIACQCVSAEDSLVGFSNVGVATVAVLFVVANGVTRTNAMGILFRYTIGHKPAPLCIALLKFSLPLGLASGFLNNTPIYAMAIPVLLRWCRALKVPPSKVMMPVNVALLLGGTLTLIGTSTNLIVSGLALGDAGLVDARGEPLDFGIFGVTKVGAIYFAIGMVYVVALAPVDALLPVRETFDTQVEKHAREYMVAMRVSSTAKTVVGMSIEEAGLRHLRGLFLVEIQRGPRVIPAPGPETRIDEGDVLVFSGQIDTVVDLYKRDTGLIPIQSSSDDSTNVSVRFSQSLFEVVVSPNSMLLNGRRIRDVEFRQRFGAAVVAVASSSGALLINQKLGDVQIYGGDTLLVEADGEFYRRHGRDTNFALVFPLKDSSPPRDDWLHIIVSLIIAAAMVSVAASGVVGIYTTAVVAALAMLITGCQTVTESGDAVDLPVILTIAFAFGVGRALEETGVGTAIAKLIVSWMKPLGPIGVLFAIYFVVALLTSVITNNGAVAVMFPIVSNIIKAGEVDNLNPYAAMYVLMLAGSASFMTPIGYQTNLMAHSAGAYHFADWARFGAGLQVVLMVVGVLAAHMLYKD